MGVEECNPVCTWKDQDGVPMGKAKGAILVWRLLTVVQMADEGLT